MERPLPARQRVDTLPVQILAVESVAGLGIRAELRPQLVEPAPLTDAVPPAVAGDASRVACVLRRWRAGHSQSIDQTASWRTAVRYLSLFFLPREARNFAFFVF